MRCEFASRIKMKMGSKLLRFLGGLKEVLRFILAAAKRCGIKLVGGP